MIVFPMPLKPLFCTLALAAAALAAPAVEVTPNGASIGRYEIYELALRHGGEYANPWEDVDIAAEFRSPSGKTFQVGGFYYDRDTWKVRFAPAEAGRYRWTLTFTAPSGEYRATGGFRATPSKNSGFLRLDPSHPQRFVTEGTGAVFYPLGLQQGFGKKLPLQFFLPQVVRAAYPVAPDDYFSTYTAAGFNFWRLNGEPAVDVAAFNVNGTGRNVFRAEEGQVRDTLFASLHRYGWKVMFSPMAAPNDYAKKFDLADPMVKQALMKIYRYNISRFGAYVDVWELMNENGGMKIVPPAFYDTAAEYIRGHDPYRHPITTSYEPPEPHRLLELSAPHVYFSDSNLRLDAEFTAGNNAVKAKLPGRMIIWGELGNRCPVPDNDVPNERYRILLWTSFFNEAFIVPWNSTDGRAIPCVKAGPGLSNLFIGTLQREQALAFWKSIADFDPAAVPVPVEAAPASRVRAYALGSAKEIGGYLIHTTSHSVTVSGVQLAIQVPRKAVEGRWIDPKTGAVIARFSVKSGLQTVRVPDFAADIAVRIGPSLP